MKNNKILVCLLSVFMLITATFITSAEPIDNSFYIEDTADFRIDPTYKMELENNSKRVRAARTSTTLNISRLTQYDSRWANDALNGCSGTTIKSSGCALVSMTMVYNYVKSKSVTPAYLNNNYVACPMNWNTFATNLGFSRVAYGSISSTNAYSTFKTYLDNGDPIVVQVKKGSNAHFMVVYGYNSSGKVLYVRDPDSTNFTTISASENSGWILTYYHVYS